MDPTTSPELLALRPARVKAVSAALIPDAMGITRV